MRLPDFTDSGELPLGVHRATLRETLARFAVGDPQRIVVGERLERIYHVASATGHLARFVVFGSFVTDKPAPNDVDVFLIMDDAFDGNTLHGEAALLFDHAAADVHFGASVFWVRRLAAFGGEQTTIEYWQAKRGGGRRGIIEIVEDTNDHERPGT
ncbi:MAG: hypothetical protein GX575_10730 [Candidatus Anammoximicrobium sp.]|nr:hypothetical protein [Candidatus Anammoximicrobium sp.]